MKTVVLLISPTFFKGHINAGEKTGFVEKIASGQKIHTIRANAKYWLDKAALVNSGNAVLSLRQWEGVPYHSHPVEFAQLSKLNIQLINFRDGDIRQPYVNGQPISLASLSAHDGLTEEQLISWFRCYNLRETMAIIHFTENNYY